MFEDAPKAPFVSVSPSGRIVEGGSLTLICNSEAHPPVYNHSWFKKTATGSVQIGSDKNHKFSDIMLEDSGRYYCVAKNELGEESSSMMYIEVTGKNTSSCLLPHIRLILAVFRPSELFLMLAKNS